MDFIKALARELRGWQDETIYLSYASVAEMVARAAGAVLGENEVEAVTVHHVVEPDGARVYHILRVDTEIAGENEIMLDASEIATLRAILATYNEQRGPWPGDPLTMPMKLEGGEIVTVWPGDV